MSRTVKAKITVEERDLILKHVLLCMNPSVEERIRKKGSRNGYVSIELDQQELSELIGSVAAEANHTTKKGLCDALNELCDQLESLEDDLRYA